MCRRLNLLLARHNNVEATGGRSRWRDVSYTCSLVSLPNYLSSFAKNAVLALAPLDMLTCEHAGTQMHARFLWLSLWPVHEFRFGAIRVWTCRITSSLTCAPYTSIFAVSRFATAGEFGAMILCRYALFLCCACLNYYHEHECVIADGHTILPHHFRHLTKAQKS